MLSSSHKSSTWCSRACHRSEAVARSSTSNSCRWSRIIITMTAATRSSSIVRAAITRRVFSSYKQLGSSFTRAWRKIWSHCLRIAPSRSHQTTMFRARSTSMVQMGRRGLGPPNNQTWSSNWQTMVLSIELEIETKASSSRAKRRS